MSHKSIVEVQINEQIRAVVPETEVKTKGSRRRFTKEYKLKVLNEAEKCTESGELGALLRREGLYDSHLWRWRQAEREGRLGSSGKERKAKAENKLLKQNVQKFFVSMVKFPKTQLSPDVIKKKLAEFELDMISINSNYFEKVSKE